MVTSKYAFSNGIELPAAFFVLKTTSTFSHTVEVSGVTTEVTDVECTFDIFATEQSYIDKKDRVDTVTYVFNYDPDELLYDQVYRSLRDELAEGS